MAGELEKALSSKLGKTAYNDELVKAMSLLLILLLGKVSEKKKVAQTRRPVRHSLAESIRTRMASKYPVFKNRVHGLIPSPS